MNIGQLSSKTRTLLVLLGLVFLIVLVVLFLRLGGGKEKSTEIPTDAPTVEEVELIR